MSLLRRRSKPIFVLFAVAVLALAVSACSRYKFESLQLSQPSGIGKVRVHFEICTEPQPQEGAPAVCGPNTPFPVPIEEPEQVQQILGIAVPIGSTAPATITGTPLKGGEPIVFTRNDQAAQEITNESAGSEEPWPPAGAEGIGYLSAPVSEQLGDLREWSFDPEFGLPAAADGGSFGGPFATTIAAGTRGVGGEFGAADRPVDCIESFEEADYESALCEVVESKQIGVSDLKIGAAPQVSAFLGGKATLSFPFDFASTVSPLPTFALAATSTLPKAAVALPSPTFAPGAGAPPLYRSPAVSGAVVVSVPKDARPGLYDVTLTAATPQGATVSQVAKLQVAKAKLRFGKVRLNKATGTATLLVKVPAAGALIVSGKGVTKAKRQAKAAGTLKVPIKAKGKARAQLGEDGKAKVKAKISFKPTGAAPVVKSKTIVLKKS